MELNSNEYNPYYDLYLSKCPYSNIEIGLEESASNFISFLKAIPEDKFNFKYAFDKWTLKEVLIHIIDTERIFAYRALRIARRDLTPLPGFDQDEYVKPSNAGQRTMTSIIEEFETVRHATSSLFKSFGADDLMQLGQASGNAISVRALGFILIGHQNHHEQIIKERYL